MSPKVLGVALVALVFAAAVAPRALGNTDVAVYLIPQLEPFPDEVVTTLPDPLPSTDRLANPAYVLEVWLSDVGAVNTGVVAAYFDVTYDNTDITHATGLAHSGLFAGFPEGVLGDGIITNFGGSDTTFEGQGVEPEFAKLGYIDFDADANGFVTFDASPGEGGIGVLGRTVGEVTFFGATLQIVPEPGSFMLLAFGWCAYRLRRRAY